MRRSFFFSISLLFVGIMTTGQLSAQTDMSSIGEAALRQDSVGVFVALPASEYPVGSVFSTQLCGVEAVQLEYPEYELLTKEEIRTIKQQNITLPSQIDPEYLVVTERKERRLEVSFSPFVKRGGKYYRLTSVRFTPKETLTRIRNPRLQENSDGGRYAEHSVLQNGKWVKIHVSEEGVYRLTPSWLASMGFSDANRVKVYGYGGRALPETFNFSGENALIDDLPEVPTYKNGNDLLFFAEGVTRWEWDEDFEQYSHQPSPYSSYSYYFITEGEAPLQMQTISEQTASQTIATVPHHALYEKDAYAWFGGGRNFVDNYDFSTGRTHSFTLATPGIVTGEQSTIDIAFTAAGATSTTPVAITLAGSSLGNLSVPAFADNESAREVIRTYNSRSLASSNTFTFTTGNSNPARLDFIRATYPMRLSATMDGVSFSPCQEGAVTLQIADASETTQLWMIGEGANATSRIPASLSGNVLTATVPNGMARYVLVNTAKTYETPVKDGDVANQDLHGESEAYDMVIIISESELLLEQAERLATLHREKDGLRVKIVNAGLLYNEFSSGTPDAGAYRRYVKMLYDKAQTAEDMPRFLLFFGDCFYDNRGVTAEGRRYNLKDFLLSYEPGMGYATDFAIGTLNSYVTDDFFGLLDDGEGTRIMREKTDIAIGRIPIHDVTNASYYVDKVIGYVSGNFVGSWKNRLVFIGDDIDNNMHMKGAESAIAQTEAQAGAAVIRRIYPDATKRVVTATNTAYPESTSRLIREMDRGALMFNYTGHGGPTGLSHSTLLWAKDFVEHAGTRPALWAFASCEITPYDQQEEENLGRMSLFSHEGGAIAVMCSARAVYASYNSALNDLFCQNVFSKDATTGRRHTIGEALRLCKNGLIASGRDATYNKLKYALLGDPAVALQLPTGVVVLDSIDGQLLSESTFMQLKAGQIVRFSGHVAPEGDASAIDTQFNGEVAATLFDRLETVTCLNNAGTADTPMTYQERTVQLYEGRDSIRAGKFSFEARIPLALSYSEDDARIVLYAVNNERDKECHGESTQFYLNGTADSGAHDTQGPTVVAVLGNPDGYVEGTTVGSVFTLNATIEDESGINTTSASVGHDMEMWIDGDKTDVTVLNDYFQYDFGSYQSGSIAYPVMGLSEGRHTLTLRVWDVFDNSTTVTLGFNVRFDITTGLSVFSANNPAQGYARLIIQGIDTESTEPVYVSAYDISGRRLWTQKIDSYGKAYAFETWQLKMQGGAGVTAGIYILKATQGGHESPGVKVIVTR